MDMSKYDETWQLLKALKAISPYLWLCIGDFNEILSQFEKIGAAWRSLS